MFGYISVSKEVASSGGRNNIVRMHDGRVMECRLPLKIMTSTLACATETIARFADTFEEYIQLSPIDKGTHVGCPMAEIAEKDPGKTSLREIIFDYI